MQGSDRVSKIERDKRKFDDEHIFFEEQKGRTRRKSIKLNRVSGLYYYHKRFSHRGDQL